ncbi:MAG TPA: SRPBCC family protein [Reyranella sp.]|nr:SRPBCC family protein [Reyranella sp.]
MSAIPPDWARSLVDPQLFQVEQRALAHVWTFLGLTRDVARDGDWIRASIATRSVFVQRFGDELRGFENLCAHRFYPLRNADKGNGPLICGYHHWQYNRDGVAVGIPVCADMYGKPPHEMDARLNRIEIAACGAMIFGRFPSPTATETLEEFLGDAFPILEGVTRMKIAPRYLASGIQANWKLNMHISLDDYHNPAVHPATFGKKGYLTVENCHYVRMGVHSAFLQTRNEHAFDRLLAGSRDGSFRSDHYFILQILPDLMVAHVDADHRFWFVNIMQYAPVAVDRTAFRSWSFPTPFEEDLSWFGRATRPITDRFRRPLYFHYYKQVVRQDIAVCERLQTVAHQIDRAPMLGALEERIAWFEDSMRELTGRAAKAMEMKEQETGQ